MMSWPDKGDDATTQRLREIVDGQLEVIMFTENLHMWVNEDGSRLKEPNPYAAWLARTYTWPVSLYGTVVLTGGVGELGAILSLTDDQVHEIANLPWPPPV
jgi:hypothetical protein